MTPWCLIRLRGHPCSARDEFELSCNSLQDWAKCHFIYLLALSSSISFLDHATTLQALVGPQFRQWPEFRRHPFEHHQYFWPSAAGRIAGFFVMTRPLAGLKGDFDRGDARIVMSRPSTAVRKETLMPPQPMPDVIVLVPGILGS